MTVLEVIIVPKMFNKMKNKGFTLIELIVAITIIAVITALAVVNFGGTNKRARDSRRMADLEKIRIALESYRQQSSTNVYPTSIGVLVTGNFLQAQPTDPKTGANYGYRRITNYTYEVCALLEGTGVAPSSMCSGSYNYRVINP